MQELAKIVGEDALVSKSGKEKDKHIKGDLDSNYPFEIDDDYEQNEYGYLEEGNCSCNECDECTDDGTDYSLDSMSMLDMLSSHNKHDKHNNNYMAKPALYKVSKYAQKLLQMIPDGYELDDWQRTKIAQISDDISEVYHSLDYDFYDDEC